MWRLISVLLPVVLIAFFACQATDNEATVTGFGIREDIILELQQELHPEGAAFRLVFQTAETYPCDDAVIEFTSNQSGERIDIELSSLSIPEPCSGIPGPAQAFVQMPFQQGTYDLKIGVGDVIENTGELIIDQKGYRLSMENHDGIYIPFSAIHRVPQGLIWGYVYNPQQPSGAFQKFSDGLAPHVTPSSLDAGYYGLFFATSAQHISLPLSLERSAATPFAFMFNGNPEELGNRILYARSLVPPGTEVRAFDWRGNTF